MGKLSLTGVSLIAAVPAGFLAYLMVMLFLNRFDQLATMFQVVAGSTLLLCAVVALMPVAILIFGPRSAGAAEAETDEELGGESAEMDEVSAVADEDLLADEGDELEMEDGFEDDAEIVETDQDVFEESETAEYDFDMDDIDLDEDEKKG